MSARSWSLTLLLGSLMSATMLITLGALVLWPPTQTGSYAVGFQATHAHLIHGLRARWHRGRYMDLSTLSLQPGDVLILHNPNGAFGHYTHTTVYLGDDLIYLCDAREGFSTGPLYLIRRYGTLLQFRPGDAAAGQMVADWIKEQLHRPFFIGADLLDPHFATCTSMAWQGWRLALPDLTPTPGMLSPDQLAEQWQPYLVTRLVPER